MIRMGNGGPMVRDLQEMLNFAVPLRPLLQVDGRFGPRTNERVLTFQRDEGLMVDGIVGPQTSKALISAVIEALAVGPMLRV